MTTDGAAMTPGNDVLLARLEDMERARQEARAEDARWKAELVSRLERIETQTTLTNGNVRELQLWRARMGGFASAFSWWKPTLATIAAAGIIYWATHGGT